MCLSSLGKMYLEALVALVLVSAVFGSKLPPLEVLQQHADHHHKVESYSGGSKRKVFELSNFRIFYPSGNSESQLPLCSKWSVCNKIDLYESPWLERKCRCPEQQECSSNITANDGHTITDRHRQYKLCEPVKKLPKCRYFSDVTWTFISRSDDFIDQVVHCNCPKNSVTYLIKPQAFHMPHDRIEYHYSFACSPQSRLRCQRKEPCRLFTVHKRQQTLVEEVNINTLCQCPHALRCPHHHTDHGVIAGKAYLEESVKTYSGFCVSL